MRMRGKARFRAIDQGILSVEDAVAHSYVLTAEFARFENNP
jgi:hypothetical protein